MASATAELREYAPLLLDALNRAPMHLIPEGVRLKDAVTWVVYSADVLYLFVRREEIQRFTTAYLVPQIKAYVAKVDGGNASDPLAALVPSLTYLFGVTYDQT